MPVDLFAPQTEKRPPRDLFGGGGSPWNRMPTIKDSAAPDATTQFDNYKPVTAHEMFVRGLEDRRKELGLSSDVPVMYDPTQDPANQAGFGENVARGLKESVIPTIAPFMGGVGARLADEQAFAAKSEGVGGKIGHAVGELGKFALAAPFGPGGIVGLAAANAGQTAGAVQNEGGSAGEAIGKGVLSGGLTYAGGRLALGSENFVKDAAIQAAVGAGFSEAELIGNVAIDVATGKISLKQGLGAIKEAGVKNMTEGALTQIGFSAVANGVHAFANRNHELEKILSDPSAPIQLKDQAAAEVMNQDAPASPAHIEQTQTPESPASGDRQARPISDETIRTDQKSPSPEVLDKNQPAPSPDNTTQKGVPNEKEVKARQVNEEVLKEPTPPSPSPESQSATRPPLQADGEGSAKKIMRSAGEESPEGMTSSRKVDLERDIRNLIHKDEPYTPQRRSFEEARQEAIDKGIPERALDIAAEIKANPRPLTYVETAGLTHRMAEIKLELRRKSAEMKSLKDAGEMSGKFAEIKRLEDDYFSIASSNREAGAESGRSQVFRKLTLNEDLDLVSVVDRARHEKGSNITTKERAEFEELTSRIEQHEARIAELEKSMKDATARRAIRESKAKELGRMERKAKDARLEELYTKARELIAAGCHN